MLFLGVYPMIYAYDAEIRIPRRERHIHMTSITRRLGYAATNLSIPRLTDWTLPRLIPALSDNVRLLVSGWWRDDPRPFLEPIQGFQVRRSTDASLIATLAGIAPYEAAMRMQDGHLLYLGWLDQQPVAYGWSAVQRAEIGEIGCSFVIPDSDRYLWDFATLPAWRGCSLYPRLLQAILAAESNAAERFWIAYLPQNHASERGIVKAGFRPVGAVVGADGRLRFRGNADTMRSRHGAALLGLRRSRNVFNIPRF